MEDAGQPHVTKSPKCLTFWAAERMIFREQYSGTVKLWQSLCLASFDWAANLQVQYQKTGVMVADSWAW